MSSPEHSIGRSHGRCSTSGNYNNRSLSRCTFQRLPNSLLSYTLACKRAKEEREREREKARRRKRGGRATDTTCACCSGLRRYRKSGVLRARRKKNKKRNPGRPPEEKEEEKEREGEQERRNAETRKRRKKTPGILYTHLYRNAHPEPNKNTAITRHGVSGPNPSGKHAITKIELRKELLLPKTGRTFLRHFRGPKTMAFQG